MKRRTFIRTFAGSVAASGLVVGSGAFNFANVERTVSISVVDDDRAFLKLTQRGTGRRSYTDGATEMVGFDIPGPSESDYGGTDPDGLGSNSVYRFASDAANDEPGLFGVMNQGTNPVRIYSSQATTKGVPTITIFDVETGETLTEDSPSELLGVGDELLCGLEIDTHGTPVQDDDYDVTLSINAKAPTN
ncbi:MAG: hypothetical protein ACQEQY_00605 [Halobacteriota archaeon]